MDLGAFFTSFLSDAYRRRVFEDDSVLEHSFPHDLKTVKPLGSYPFPSPFGKCVRVFEILQEQNTIKVFYNYGPRTIWCFSKGGT